MGAAAAPGLDVPLALRLGVGDLYCAYADALDDGELERWPDFFLEECIYKVVPRENFERNLPIALISCESRKMLRDRVTSHRETALFAPRLMRHLISNVRIRALAPEGIRVSASFALMQTMLDQPSELFLCGTYHDLVVEAQGELRFAEKICVYDSTIVPTSLVFPV
jgi:3-phenylpropionate/cinnamic acid dioxygenase small subunit